MPPTTPIELYDLPVVYDVLFPPGPCDSFYRRMASREGASVLELGCGTGRLTLPIARDGRRITGLDSSESMLDRARSKADAEGLRLKLLTGDMRTFEMSERFDLIILSCNVLAHLKSAEEIIACLQRIETHLAPDGLVALDVMNPRSDTLIPTIGSVATPPTNGAPFDMAVREHLLEYDPITQVRTLEWTLLIEGDEVQKTAPMHLRLFYPQELNALAIAAGLQIVSHDGDFEGGKLTSESHNQVCVLGRSLANIQQLNS